MSISHDELKRLLRYDPETGLWFRRTSFRANYQVDDRADRLQKRSGYYIVRIKRRGYPAARLAIFYMTGEWPPFGTDHKDANPGNNKWKNIRPADQTENNANARRRKDNKSGYRGVSWTKDKRKWHARIVCRGKVKLLGYFKDPYAAHLAYRKAAKEVFGVFARPGMRRDA